MSFELLPAIDLRGGRVVRLVEGDFGRETRYANDPLAVAEGFAAAGATWLHVVDLDAARDGEGTPANRTALRRLVDAVGGRMAVEVGGGIRSAAAAEAWLELGVRRVVLGTALLRDPELGATLVRRVGSGRVAAALDVREGAAVGEGWRPGAVAAPVEVILDRLAGVGIETFVATAIARDGRLGGPDLDLLGRLVHRRRGRIVASGGIAGLADLEAVIRLGCAGAIVGRALYEGRLDLGAALALVDRLGRS
ncbi:MAG TPA: 1-(5-phosphoribosyl)-5-[(5-phosphoribosylamino)methylideneamino] imidazole-4-carboxamide isomerase [Candidatus Binatia bacterium]|nr:1-(5-phosphoribosyl)-5-[(5-phosphoribosylamino)methylideneamino] imidazole-4-carboxamide isomerase [Candidatus Binatia bacterium]